MLNDNFQLMPFQKRTWAEINLNAIKDNYIAIRKKLNKETKLCCVIKANAYGHGAIQLAEFYEKLGADYFAVSNVEEAMQLRDNGISLPILILGYTDPECVDALAQNNISQCVYSEEYGELLASEAEKQCVDVKIHIKLDTGMGRIGFICKRANDLEIDVIEKTTRLEHLIPEGIFTHFASADEGIFGEQYTKEQFMCFRKTIEELEGRGVIFSIKHCANSASIIEYPDMQMDMVRAGVILYGLQPSNELQNDISLNQAMTLHSIVSHIKEVKANDCVSYGREFVARDIRKIATIPIGYADGLWRANAKTPLMVEIEGKFAPIVGRICMDQCMVDVTDNEEICLGSEVVVYGMSAKNSIDTIAKNNRTINYEIVCALGERVPRVYVLDNINIAITDNIVR
jgi:alanine racemase